MSGKLLSGVRDDPVCRRLSQVSMMAQMQNIIDFPPAPKLDASGRLDQARRASRS
ncbi:hypothetical protein I6F15_31480 [Bradyrhizobium sp. BRP14]|nr:hypothetical protein [Bradyrhizobium sp. BRP14]